MMFWRTLVIHKCWLNYWRNLDLFSSSGCLLSRRKKIVRFCEETTIPGIDRQSSNNDQKHDKKEVVGLEVSVISRCGIEQGKEESIEMPCVEKVVGQMVKNCLIVNFSGVSAAQFCSDWLTLTDFCKLDSALCVTSTRKDFLTKIAQNMTVFFDRITDNNSAPNNKLFMWMRDRKVFARHFVLNSPIDTYVKYNFSYYADGGIFQHATTVHFNQGCGIYVGVNFDKIHNVLKIRNVLNLSVCAGASDMSKSDLTQCIASYQHLKQFTLHTNHRSSMNDSYLQLIAERFPKQTELYLRDSQKVTDKMLIKVAAACPGLRRVDVRDSSITGVSLVRLVQYCGGLTDLRIARCSKVSEELIGEISQCCPSLAVLDVSHTKLTTTSLICLRNFTELHSLNMSDTGGFTVAALNNAMCRPNMTWLDISNTTLGGSTLKSMAEVFPNLLHLNAVNCGAQASDVLAGAAQHWNQLTYLDLSSGDRYSKDTSLYVGLEALIAANNFLFTLKVCCRANDVAVLGIAESACKDCLTWLDLSRCSSLTDTSIEALAAECSTLTHLNLDECIGLTDASLVCLAQGCPKLSWLSVKGCGKVSLKAIADVLEKCDKIETFHH